MSSEDKPIVDLYVINVEIDRETEVIQPTGIVSMDFQAAQSTEERIEATLKNMGLALNEREVSHITYVSLVRFQIGHYFSRFLPRVTSFGQGFVLEELSGLNQTLSVYTT